MRHIQAPIAGAAAIARGMGVSSVAVGLTVVAFGTSAPELVVAVTGTAKGAGGIAFGNVVGANIINIAFILGLTATIRPLVVLGVASRVAPIQVPARGPISLMIGTGLTILLVLMVYVGKLRIRRAEGLILLTIFFAYMVRVVRFQE